MGHKNEWKAELSGCWYEKAIVVWIENQASYTTMKSKASFSPNSDCSGGQERRRISKREPPACRGGSWGLGEEDISITSESRVKSQELMGKLSEDPSKMATKPADAQHGRNSLRWKKTPSRTVIDTEKSVPGLTSNDRLDFSMDAEVAGNIKGRMMLIS